MGTKGESLEPIEALLGGSGYRWPVQKGSSMTQSVNPIELLTVEEAARWCHISPNTLNYLRLQRRFAPAIRVGRRVFFKPEDLNDWLEAQREVLE